MSEIATLIIIVGLGNPGPTYQMNRHNIGFMAVDRIASRYDFPNFTKKGDTLISEGHIGLKRTLLIKPQSYMNLSGKALAPIARFYKVPHETIFVIHDELDLTPGKVRVKRGGSPGGHNGLKDIDTHFGKNYWRIRLGIGHPGHKDAVTPYVLSDFKKTDYEWLNLLLETVADELPFLIEGDKDLFMSNVAQIMTTIKPKELQ